MRTLTIEHVSKSYSKETVLHNISFTVPAGKFFALLGPSGCGKTTLLRLIGGFETVDRGRIYLGDEDITHTPINERRINTVFQNYALFPHLNVFDNVAYSLRLKQFEKGVVEQKVIKILESFRLENHIYKNISQLSGGQQQRVALARAVVNEPEVLLLDEPLAALDYNLREKMLIELIELQDKLKTTFIYVTHDQFEALTVADQMAIMNHGTIAQIGSPRRIYEFPESAFVAQFVGTTNIFKGTLEKHNDNYVIQVKELGPLTVLQTHVKPNWKEGMAVLISLRPEKIRITGKTISAAPPMATGAVESIVYHGRSTQFNVRTMQGQRIQVFKQNEEHIPEEIIDYDQQVNLYWQAENMVLLEQ